VHSWVEEQYTIEYAVLIGKITTKTSEVNMLNRFTLPVIIEKDKDGYFAFCPDLQGCYTQGDSYEEVLSNIEDAIRLHIEDRLENGESIPISM
jgi:predicted RNase H-like HicB family nuclease